MYKNDGDLLPWCYNFKNFENIINMLNKKLNINKEGNIKI